MLDIKTDHLIEIEGGASLLNTGTGRLAPDKSSTTDTTSTASPADCVEDHLLLADLHVVCHRAPPDHSQLPGLKDALNIYVLKSNIHTTFMIQLRDISCLFLRLECRIVQSSFYIMFDLTRNSIT